MSVPSQQMSLPAEQQEQANQELAAMRERQLQMVDALAGRLSAEVVKVSGDRQVIEERWLEDLRQHDGVYDDATMQRIRAARGSELFVNITRPKVRTAESRLGDMLFPTDDKNWAVKPTPVPELKGLLQSTKPLTDPSGQQIMVPPGPNGEPGRPMTVGDRTANALRKANEKAELMEAEIDDQLTEADYPTKCRQAIHDAVLLGTGIIKGPIVVGRTRRQWTVKNGMRVLEQVTDPRPWVDRVDPWNFFPDPSAATMDEARFVYERKYLTAKRLAKLALDPYYLGANILRVLGLGAKASHLTRNPTMEKRDNSGEGAVATNTELFEVWEYHGPIERDDLSAMGVELPENLPEGTVTGCVVFVGAVVIKAYLNPLDTGELPYSVFCYERDESCIFGFGVPYRLRHSQKALNAAWRALMDNAALSVGPQIVVDKKIIQPADGDWSLRGRKVWEKTDPTKSVRDAFATHNIDSHQAELTAIINLASRFADEESALPLIAQGEQGPGVTKTMGGMAMLNNNANVVTRATVKNFDDGITMSIITRFYDWNMQYSDKEDIKGDYEVDARGSSVLLAREIQAQNLMALGANFAPSPLFGPMTRPLQLYRQIVRSMQLSSDEIVVSDDEWKALQNSKSQQSVPPEVQAEQLRQQFEQQQFEREVKAKQQLEDQRHQNRMAEHRMEVQDNMLRYATQERMGLDKLQAMLAGKAQDAQAEQAAIITKAEVDAQVQAVKPQPQAREQPPR